MEGKGQASRRDGIISRGTIADQVEAAMLVTT
jgi:hypothetical protein